MSNSSSPPLASVPQHPQRLVYLGTPQMAVAPLQALHAAGFDVALVITGEDKKRSRGSKTSPTPVKAAANDLGIEVAHDPALASEVNADLGVVVAFGQILRRPLLERLPMVNLHFSLLPRWRGAAPVERAILAGDQRSGVCVMAVEEGLDTGGVYARSEVSLTPRTTALDLSRTLTEVGSELLVAALRDGLVSPVPQAGDVTYAHKITSADLAIRWNEPAELIDRLVRVGGAWTTSGTKRLKVLKAEPVAQDLHVAAGELVGDLVACGGDTSLRLIEVQAEGKAATTFSAWANGARPQPGHIFGATS